MIQVLSAPSRKRGRKNPRQETHVESVKRL